MSRQQRREQLRRARKHGDTLAPGVYAFEGALLVDAGEFCRGQGVPVTRENVERAVSAARRVCAERGLEFEAVE